MSGAPPVSGAAVAAPRAAEAGGSAPTALILIAADPISGPGKGLLQFLKHAPESFRYILGNFDVTGRSRGHFVEEALRRGLNVVLLKQRSALDPSMVTQANRIMRERALDVVQTHGHKPNVIGFFLHLLFGRPWIGFAHGYIEGNWKVRLYNWIDLAVVRRADRIVTVSGSMTDLLVAHGVRRDKIRLVYNAVESERPSATTSAADVRARHGIRPGDLAVGVIGRLNSEKGQLTFLKAFQTTLAACPTAKALLIGDGPDQAMLERYCADHGLSDHVVFTGHQRDVASFYQMLDLLVLPSRSEGLPNTVLEAMSFGIPVLATCVGGVPEIIGDDNGVMVPPDDPPALAAEMTALLADAGRRDAIGTRGRLSLFPRFDAAERSRRILALYDEVLADRRRADRTRKDPHPEHA